MVLCMGQRERQSMKLLFYLAELRTFSLVEHAYLNITLPSCEEGLGAALPHARSGTTAEDRSLHVAPHPLRAGARRRGSAPDLGPGHAGLPLCRLAYSVNMVCILGMQASCHSSLYLLHAVFLRLAGLPSPMHSSSVTPREVLDVGLSLRSRASHS